MAVYNWTEHEGSQIRLDDIITNKQTDKLAPRRLSVGIFRK